MKVILVGGGTAGHINPALSIADYIKEKEPNSKILYVGAKGGMEEKMAKDAGLEFCGITVSGFSRKLNLEGLKKNFITLKNIIISSFESRKILKKWAPDICIGTGGYVCGTFLRESAKMNIPFLIHDSNSFPGITTKLLAKKAYKVLLINEEAAKHLPKNISYEITGTPVRKSIKVISKNEAREKLGIKKESTVILSFGGSLGAKAINNVIAEIIIKHKNDSDFTYIHGFGKKGYDFKEKLEKAKINIGDNKKYIINEYINNMPECMAAADLVICRAGATTLSELQAASKPSILIPSPNVAENHQFHNAMALVRNNAAEIIEEKDLTPEKLWQKINNTLQKDVLETYTENLKKIAITNANEKIYKIIKNAVNKNK